LTETQKVILRRILREEKVECDLGTNAANELYNLRAMCLIRYGYGKRWELTPEGIAEVAKF
jgi:hypothetical protein